MIALKITDLYKQYATGVEALKGLNLEIKVGDFFALLGHNGAGKSTTIGIICSLISKTKGSVNILGHDIDDNFAKAKRNLGIVPQEFNFSIFETAWQILIQQAGYYGVSESIAAIRAEKYLKMLNLWEKRHARSATLSGGMKRRLMICRALIHEPPILILDEPTAGVDVEARRLVWDFLKQLNKSGKTIILTTHYLEEVESLCHNLAIIDNGRIIAHDSVRNIMRQLTRETYCLDLKSPLQKLPLLEGVQFSANTDDKHNIEVSLDRNFDLCQLFAELHKAGAIVRGIRNKNNPLEELFLQLTTRKS
jgi:ABC-2 type transport system ATP-binding protein